MQDIGIVLERHEQKIEALQRELTAMKEIQSEIRAMNERMGIPTGFDFIKDEDIDQMTK